MKQTTLYYREDPSDKIYQARIEPKDDGYIVRFAYGRRGSTLQTGTKTPAPVSLEQAERIFGKLIKEKKAKGYKEEGEPSSLPVPPNANGQNIGIRCQLLNPVDESEIPGLLRDDRWCLQEKFDGRRMMVRKAGQTVTGINRKGLMVSLPLPIVEAAQEIPFDFLIDGEAIGDVLHTFDLLELRKRDLRPLPYADRLTYMVRWIDTSAAIRLVPTVFGSGDKSALHTRLKKQNAEGMVFKDLNAPVIPGRPASGGSQLKFKFVETASFIVLAVNAKRSIRLGLMDDTGTMVPAGNVTIPPNMPIPAVGAIADVRYLYAQRQSGSAYQPVYLGERDDINPADCVVSQLKFKPDDGVNAAA
ncbi:WGR domain-containing protein [Luteolibacter sp. SL250]|uniref:WGR domain-containing protein n=1 Tax=Luteolibacter sp. SL250 TaxID=2995170 RepID=UPI00226FD567|nr:WGR domain-containing protein [Luteolibacter sp. SL250]WAC21097.1 WGR domain-containing protein [Luteolibacter sp. SL250]